MSIPKHAPPRPIDAALLHKLKEILQTNCAERGMDKLPPSSDLEDAALALWQSQRVLILTGFLIASRTTGETDGPPGALNLAYACDQLGKDTNIVTDKYSLEALRVGLEQFRWRRTPRVISLERGNEELISYNLLSQFVPDHLVAIERPGQNAEGRYHNMAGQDFTDLVPDSDTLLYLAREQGIGITAIGDGGNEVGMGKITAYIAEHVPFGERIAAAFAADHLIVTGISNWGATALTVLLSLLAAKPLLLPQQREEALLTCLVEAGLVDGSTRRRELSVDGMSLADYLQVYDRMVQIMEEGLLSAAETV